VRRKSQTKAGMLLKDPIPTLTCAVCNDALPGFVDIAFVGHKGGKRSDTTVTTTPPSWH